MFFSRKRGEQVSCFIVLISKEQTCISIKFKLIAVMQLLRGKGHTEE